MDNEEPLEGTQPTLFRATVSFLSSLGLVVILFFVVGHYSWFGAADEGAELQGIYVRQQGRPATAAGAGAAFDDEYSLRFLDGERVEVQLRGGFVDAFYEVRDGHVRFAGKDQRGRERHWDFEIAGDHLTSGGQVFQRVTE